MKISGGKCLKQKIFLEKKNSNNNAESVYCWLMMMVNVQATKQQSTTAMNISGENRFQLAAMIVFYFVHTLTDDLDSRDKIQNKAAKH